MVKPVVKYLSLFIFCAAFYCHAATLEWDANPPEENVHRYNVWSQSGTNSWALIGTVTNATTFTIPTPTNTTRFAVSALTISGFESALSDAVEVIIPAKPKAPRVRLTLQGSADPRGPFSDVTNILADLTFLPSAFYRGKLTIEN